MRGPYQKGALLANLHLLSRLPRAVRYPATALLATLLAASPVPPATAVPISEPTSQAFDPASNTPTAPATEAEQPAVGPESNEPRALDNSPIVPSTPAEVAEFLRLINDYRASNGAPTLILAPAVSAAAQAWAESQPGYPSAQNVPESLLPAGYSSFSQAFGSIFDAGGSPDPAGLVALFTADYGSPRARLLRDPAYGDVGIASIRSGSNLYLYAILAQKPRTTYATDYVKYPWAPSIYSVEYDPSGWRWKQLSFSEWTAAGSPLPRTAGWIQGTRLFTLRPSPNIYAQSPDGGIHLLNLSQWRDSGYKQPTPSAGDFVRYSWSPSIYFVEYASPNWVWKQLAYNDWREMGTPAARTAGFIAGSTYYKYRTGPELFVLGPDKVTHKLSYAEWDAAGHPSANERQDGYFKTAWAPMIYYNGNLNVENSRSIGYQEWASALFPEPMVSNQVPFSFYWQPTGRSDIYYRTPDGSDLRMSLMQWMQAGSPWPRPYGHTPPAGER